MLRLTARGEQGYDDIAALMGISAEEARERVEEARAELEREKAALAELEGSSGERRGAGPVAEGGTSSSQAAGEAPPSAPPAPAAASQTPPAGQRSAEGIGARGRMPRVGLPDSQGARAAIAAGVVAVVVLVVVLVLGGGGDDGSSTGGSKFTAAETGTGGQVTSANAKELTKAVLSPVAGAEGAGVAIFGRVKKSLALQVEAEGLEPTGKGESYTVWLAQSPRKMLPLAEVEVGADGRIGSQVPVPTEVLSYLAAGTFRQIYVTRTSDAALRASLKKATGEKKAPEYTGTPILRGTVTGPIVGAAKRSAK